MYSGPYDVCSQFLATVFTLKLVIDRRHACHLIHFGISANRPWHITFTLTLLFGVVRQNLNQLLIIIAHTWLHFINKTLTVIEVSSLVVWIATINKEIEYSLRLIKNKNLLFKNYWKKNQFLSHTLVIIIKFNYILRILYASSLKIFVIWKRDATRYLILQTQLLLLLAWTSQKFKKHSRAAATEW